MAYELHGLLAGNVSVVTGENIRPSYGGDDEAFLKKVITPIYHVIERVCFLTSKYNISLYLHFTEQQIMVLICQEASKSKNGKAPHSAWCNYDDLNEYFWYLKEFWILAKLVLWFHSNVLIFNVTMWHSGHLIVSLWDGLCVMMVIFLNQYTIQGQYLWYVISFPLVHALKIPKRMSC